MDLDDAIGVVVAKRCCDRCQTPAGTSALFVLVRKVTPDKVLDQLKGFKGKVLKTSLTADKEEELRKFLEQS